VRKGVGEGVCGIEQLSFVVLQVDVTGMWIWKFHSSYRYIVKSAYNLLTTSKVGDDDHFNHVVAKTNSTKCQYFYLAFVPK